MANVYQVAAEMIIHSHERRALHLMHPSLIAELANLKARWGIQIHLDDIIDSFLQWERNARNDVAGEVAELPRGTQGALAHEPEIV